MASRLSLPLFLSGSCCNKISKNNSNSYSTFLLRKNPAFLTLFTPKFISRSELKPCHLINLNNIQNSINCARNFSLLSKPCLVPLLGISNINQHQSFSSKTQTKSVVSAETSENERPRVDTKEAKGLGGDGSGENKIKKAVVSEFLSLPEDMSQNSFLKSEYAGVSWKTIYKYNHIKTARVVQRFKLYQTAFTGLLAVPAAFGFYMHGLVEWDAVAFTGSACGFACAMLYIMGNFFSKLIGFVYVSDHNPDVVRVAHMTFWGGRKDDLFSKEDFIPFSDLPDNVQDAYIHVKTYSEPEKKLYLTLKYGEVLDLEEFEGIFGRVPELTVTRKTKK